MTSWAASSASASGQSSKRACRYPANCRRSKALSCRRSPSRDNVARYKGGGSPTSSPILLAGYAVDHPTNHCVWVFLTDCYLAARDCTYLSSKSVSKGRPPTDGRFLLRGACCSRVGNTLIRLLGLSAKASDLDRDCGVVVLVHILGDGSGLGRRGAGRGERQVRDRFGRKSNRLALYLNVIGIGDG